MSILIKDTTPMERIKIVGTVRKGVEKYFDK